MSRIQPGQSATFSLRTPYLDDGRTNHVLAQSDQLQVRIKVYAEGGENSLHCHEQEDHAFVVLEGEATFTDEEGTTRRVGPYDGIFLARGAYYRFESTGDGNLVLLRVGSGKPSTGNDRRGPDGSLLEGRSAANKNRTPPVPRPGRRFGDPLDGVRAAVPPRSERLTKSVRRPPAAAPADDHAPGRG